MFKLKDLGYNPQAQSEAIVAKDKYRFTILSDALIRFEYSEDAQFTDAATTMVFNRDFPLVDFEVYEDKGNLHIVTDKLHIKYDQKEPSPYGFQIRVFDAGIIYHFGDEFSEAYEEFNLGGTVRTLDRVDGSTDIGMGLLSAQGYSVVDDSKSVVINDAGWFEARKEQAVDLYFFGHARDYQGALDDFYSLSGQTPLLPRFSLGNWWSRYYAYTDTEYLELMDKFSEHEIPISVAVIDMDWHITDVDPKYGSGWTGYTWNRDLFPDPEKFLDTLHDNDIKTSLNVHPAEGVRAFEESYEAMAQRLDIDPQSERTIEFDFADPEFIQAYFEEIHHPLEAEGVDFWWLDWQQGTVSRMEGLDPLWPLNHFHYLDNAERNERGLIFSRYAGLGSHRYPVGFSGDTLNTWASLDFQPYFTSRASNVGYTWWSHDIGGHMHGILNPELQVRWMQYGVYAPILRMHSSNNPFINKEPWLFDAYTEELLTKALQERYRLVPYLYTMNFKTAYENIPLVRPLYFLNPDAIEAYQVKNEYYFGTELIACPLTKKVDKETQVSEFSAYLPEGDYFDFYNGRYYRGGKSIKLFRNIEETAVFAKAGAIVPLDNSREYSNRLDNPEDLLIKVFTGADGEFTLIEDDGSKKRPNKDEVARTRFSFKYNDAKDSIFTIHPVEGDTTAIPEKRNYTIRLYGIHMSAVEAKGSNFLRYDYNQKENYLEIKVNNVDINEKLELKFENTKTKLAVELERIYDVLDRMEILYDLKEFIYYYIKDNGLNEATISSLYARVSNPKVVDVIAEFLYART